VTGASPSGIDQELAFPGSKTRRAGRLAGTGTGQGARHALGIHGHHNRTRIRRCQGIGDRQGTANGQAEEETREGSRLPAA